MYHKIVVPLDGSSFGEHALPYAVAIARRTGAHLMLVHVHTPLVYASAAPGLAPYGLESMPSYDPQLDIDRKSWEDTYLQDLSLRLQGACDVATSHVVLDGRVDDVLKDAIASSDCDMIVMATHSRGPLARFWRGSVAHQVVRSVSVPVLLVPARDDEIDVTAEKFIHKVLVPLDGSTLAERALLSAVELAAAFGARVTLLSAITALSAHLGVPQRGSVGSAGSHQNLPEYLAHMVTRLADVGVDAEMKLFVNPDPAMAILDCADAHEMEIIAIATHGRSGISRLRFGSVAERVIEAASVPVLVQPPHRG